MQSWSDIRATLVPPGHEAEAASSRAALRLALGMAGSGRDAHVVGPDRAEGLSPWFAYSLAGYVEALGGKLVVAEVAVTFPDGELAAMVEADSTERRIERPTGRALDVANRLGHTLDDEDPLA